MRHLVLVLAAGLLLSACGETPRPSSEPRVKLKLDLPDDGGMTRDDHVAVRGTVTPADAAVQIAGKDAQVAGGEFTAEISLRPGGNVIDVTATASGRRPATDALRVLRDMRIEVPALVGQDPEQAIATLRAAGLKGVEERGGNWLDRLLPGDITVCALRPGAGALLDKGSRVTLETARDC